MSGKGHWRPPQHIRIVVLGLVVETENSRLRCAL